METSWRRISGVGWTISTLRERCFQERSTLVPHPTTESCWVVHLARLKRTAGVYLLLPSDTSITAKSPSPVENRGFFQGCSFKDKYTKAGGYPDYQPKSIRQHCLQEKAFTCSQTSSFQKYNDLVRAMKLIFQKRQKTLCKHIALASACYTHTLFIFCT